MANPLINITGMRFNKLTVVSLHNSGTHTKPAKYNCVCECGKQKIVTGKDLKSGNTKSCGCYRKELTSKKQLTHGKSGTPEYITWLHMIERCSNPIDKRYHRYGGRGITVCDEWKSFTCFLNDMGQRPTPKHTLERSDNEKGYYKANCIWATKKVQAQNRSTSLGMEKVIEIKSKMNSLPIKDLAKQYDVCESTIYRIKNHTTYSNII